MSENFPQKFEVPPKPFSKSPGIKSGSNNSVLKLSSVKDLKEMIQPTML